MIVERFNRTLKGRMFRYFTRENTRRYLPVLQDLVTSYNATYHRAIKTQPRLVSPHNEHRVYETLYQNTIKTHFQSCFQVFTLILTLH